MKENSKRTEKAALLMLKAEELLKSQQQDSSIHFSESDSLKTLHELQVHQIELEMQNEELKQAWSTAEAALEKYTSIFDFAPIGLIVLDQDCKIKELNFAAARMLSSSRNYLNKRNLKEFISHDSYQEFIDFFSNVFIDDTKAACDIMLIINNKARKYVHIEGIAVEYNKKCLISILDITERKLVEQVLRQSEQNLKEVNSAKDKFFKIIAHDLRSPIGNIVTLLDYTTENFENINSDELRDFIKRILASANNIYGLLINLLSWTMTQSGQMHFEPEMINIKEILEETIAIYQELADSKSIKIISEFAENINIRADRQMLKTINRNLLSNAIKFTHLGGEITIKTKIIGNALEIFVKDNGMGMKPEELDSLFKIDLCHSYAGTDNEKGTGLGLILCKEFIERHGGRIWVVSAQGKGSTFNYSLPLEFN